MNIETIIEELQKKNPTFDDEILDLLYQYFIIRNGEEILEKVYNYTTTYLRDELSKLGY